MLLDQLGDRFQRVGFVLAARGDEQLFRRLLSPAPPPPRRSRCASGERRAESMRDEIANRAGQVRGSRTSRPSPRRATGRSRDRASCSATADRRYSATKNGLPSVCEARNCRKLGGASGAASIEQTISADASCRRGGRAARSSRACWRARRADRDRPRRRDTCRAITSGKSSKNSAPSEARNRSVTSSAHCRSSMTSSSALLARERGQRFGEIGEKPPGGDDCGGDATARSHRAPPATARARAEPAGAGRARDR